LKIIINFSLSLINLHVETLSKRGVFPVMQRQQTLFLIYEQHYRKQSLVIIFFLLTIPAGKLYPWGRRPPYGPDGPPMAPTAPYGPQRPSDGPNGPDGPRWPRTALFQKKVRKSDFLKLFIYFYY
jgi:hypothetical protein